MAHFPDTPLDYLGFRMIEPCQLLRPFIRSFWYFRREAPLTTFHEEFMHPTGGWGIVLNLGDGLYLDNEPVADPIFLDGANTISRKMGFFGRVELLGIRFYEGGAYPFLGLPLNHLKNEISLLDSLATLNLVGLHARLYESPSLASRINLLETWLLRLLARGKERSPLIPYSLTLLRSGSGQASIPTIAQKLAVSQRHLERLYQSQVGMSPKQYARLLRVESARLALKQGAHHTITELAVELGFYDQPHFIREFRAVVGMTPSAYLKRRQ